jgi:outer membrane protein assembly factor BamD
MQLRAPLITVLFLLFTTVFSLHSAEQNPTESQEVPKRKDRPDRITQPLTSNTEAANLLKQAIRDEQSGNLAQAIKEYLYIAKNYIFANEAPEAQFFLAKLYKSKGELRRSFDAFQLLITRYPETKKFDESIAEQIRIANYYLEKKNNVFLNLLMSNFETAQHMYEKILVTAPFGRYAPLVQFNLGLAYERLGRIQDAVQAYQTIIDKYPNSSVVNNAQYQIGYVHMRMGLNKNSQDLSALSQAQDQFQDYILQHAESEHITQVQKNLQTIGERVSINVYNIASFYDRNRDYPSAYIYYNDVIRLQPSSPQAALAKTRIEAIRSAIGDDALRAGPDKAETGKMAAMRRRMQAQVETQALSDYAGPSKKDIIPDELPVAKPQMRTGERDIQPLAPPEPSLPHP